MIATDHRSRVLALVMAFTVAAFALDGLAIRVIALGALAFAVWLVDGRAVARDPQLGLVMMLVAGVIALGVAMNLTKVGVALGFQAAVVLVGVVTGFVCARLPREAMHRVARALLLIYQGVLLVQIARSGISLAALTLPGASGSVNLVSGILLFLQLAHCAATVQRTGRAPLLLPFVSMVLSFPMKGRSGIALLSVLFLYCVFQRWSLNRGGRRLGLAIGTFGVAAVLTYQLQSVLLAVFQTTRLIHGFGDESRSTIREEYLASLSLWEVVAGGRYTASPAILNLLGNPHNSFIRAHYFFGLPFLVCLALLVVTAGAIALRDGGGRWFVFGLLLLFAARAFVDAMAFPGLLDFIFFYLFFLVIASQWPRHAAREISSSISTGP